MDRHEDRREDTLELETGSASTVPPRDAPAPPPWGTPPWTGPGGSPEDSWRSVPGPAWAAGGGRAPAPVARRRSPWLTAGALALALTGAAFGVHAVTAPSVSPAPVLARPQWWGTGGAGSADTPASRGWFSRGGFGQAATATDAEAAGVVDIVVALGGRGAQAAGTGMVLTSSGEVLTNKHVVEGETSMTVTVAATGRSYAAHVVGVAAGTDVAVVQLEGASGLATVTPSSQGVSIGDAVVGVGNAGGEGGTPSAASGEVTGVGQTITATDQNGSDPEQLTGLIETDAAIQPGDSGGPLLNASNQVVGMDTAGSERGAPDGYAIPIATALAAARQIESGNGAGQGNTRHGDAGQGNAPQTGSAFLGVDIQDGLGGVQVAGVVQGSPASAVGLSAGDMITSIAGDRVQTVDDVASVISSLSPGQRVSLAWIDQDGLSHVAGATLASRPST